MIVLLFDMGKNVTYNSAKAKKKKKKRFSKYKKKDCAQNSFKNSGNPVCFSMVKVSLQFLVTK